MQRIKRFLTNPIHLRFRGFVLIIGGLVLLSTLAAIPPSWEYSNSPEFCGKTCHTMPPQYASYLQSPHGNVLCVDCHIGRDWILVQASRKVGHIRLVAATVLDEFEYPIRSGEMRPARDTCEHCHTPEKFSSDSLTVIERADNNRENDLYSIYLLMHTGGGSERGGLAQGIHWHIENEVSYIALDREEQDIPWVHIKYADGTEEEFNALNSPIDTANLDKYTIREMDCISCHNRIAHLINSPEDAVDSALHAGDLSTDIPFIRARAVELLSNEYPTTKDAEQSIASLTQYYRDYYPEFYADNSALVDEAIDLINKLYKDTNYPEQLLNWSTHADNTGHKDWPGCFRCHDGQHLNEENTSIRLECNLCHSIPQVVRASDIEPNIPLATGLEPESHLDSTWINRHHAEFDGTCVNCHTVNNPGGIDNSSFCSNSTCHGSGWVYAGFDAPGLSTVLGIYQISSGPLLADFEGDPTYQDLQPLFNQQCAACHGLNPEKGLRVTDYASLLVGSENGAVVIAGDTAQSRLVEILADGHFADLADFQYELIIQWIANGAPES